MDEPALKRRREDEEEHSRLSGEDQFANKTTSFHDRERSLQKLADLRQKRRKLAKDNLKKQQQGVKLTKLQSPLHQQLPAEPSSSSKVVLHEEISSSLSMSPIPSCFLESTADSTKPLEDETNSSYTPTIAELQKKLQNYKAQYEHLIHENELLRQRNKEQTELQPAAISLSAPCSSGSHRLKKTSVKNVVAKPESNYSLSIDPHEAPIVVEEFSIAHIPHQNIYVEGMDIVVDEKSEDGSFQITQEDEEKLKRILECRIKDVSGEMQLPISLDYSIRSEKLELAEGVNSSNQMLDEENNYLTKKNHRSIIANPLRGNINLEDIFSRALERSKTLANFHERSASGLQKFVQRHGNIVALIGQAGIGKSTLARSMAQHILKGHVLKSNQYIFYVPFREVDFLRESTFFSFLMTGCDWQHSPESDEAWIKKLENNPSVVFIFDGLDEANVDEFYKCRTTETSFRSTPCDFFNKIFSGKVFPLAKKLLTSRPLQFFEMHPSLRPKFVVRILGLGPDAQDSLGKQIYNERFDEVKNFLNDFPDILSCLHVPVKCIIVYSVIFRATQGEEKTVILSLTDVFVQDLNYFIRSDHMRGKGDKVWKLALLAWRGFIERKFVFLKNDFEEAKIEKEISQAFLHTTTNRTITFFILDGDKCSSFTHLIWQELFSAIYVIYFLAIEEFDSHLPNITKPLWESVSKFMFGLCHPDVNRAVKSILPSGIQKDLDLRKQCLHSKALESLKQALSKMNDEFGHETPLLFQVCGWIHEAKDPKLDIKVSDCLPSKIKLKGMMTPTDVVSLLYVLKNSKKPLVLSVEDPTFIKDSLQRLEKGLKTLPVKIE